MKPVQTHKIETYTCVICQKRLKRHKMPKNQFFNDVYHHKTDHSLEIWSGGGIQYTYWINDNLVCEFSGNSIGDPYRRIEVKNTKTNFKKFYHQTVDHQSWGIKDWALFIQHDLILS